VSTITTAGGVDERGPSYINYRGGQGGGILVSVCGVPASFGEFLKTPIRGSISIINPM